MADFPTRRYFNELTDFAKGGTFVDCGAYRGDTVARFINWSGDRYEKIFAVEPDSGNFTALENFVRNTGYKNIKLLNCGVWDEKCRLSFVNDGNAVSEVSESGNISIDAEKLDDVIGDEKITFIKMITEGSELRGLKGATKIIERRKPLLAVSLYQARNNLITIPPFLKNIHSDYKIFLRKHSRFATAEFILYAIPQEVQQ